MSDQYRGTDRWQQIVVVERAREKRLTDVPWHGRVIPQHQVHILGRGLLREEHAYKRLETAGTFVHIGSKEPGYERKKLRRQDRHRLRSAKFGNGTDQVNATDRILAIVVDVVEDYERPIRPTTKDRMIEVQ